MRQYLRIIPRMLLTGIALIMLLLLHVSCVKGDMLLFATAEDCGIAPLSAWTVSAPHAVVLQKTNARKQRAAKQALAKAGISDVCFLDFPPMKAAYRSADILEQKWATEANTASVASLLRRWKDDCIIYYASGAGEHQVLSSFADRCAGGANDPTCRKKKKQKM